MNDLAKEEIEQRLYHMARTVVEVSFGEDYCEAMGEDFKEEYRTWWNRLLGACTLVYGDDYRENMFQLLHTAMLDKCGLGIEHLKNPY